MEEKVLVKGTMMKMNVLTIVFCVLGAWLFFGGISELYTIKYNSPAAPILLGVAIVFFGLAAYCHFLLSRCEITVTDKRVYGKAAFGKRVDLPLDMISAVGISAFKGISVATASGRLTFYLCQNRDTVFDTISQMLMERQQGKHIMHQPVVEKPVGSNADELKKYKELLDSGVITQEEFDAKKKQLLGL